MTPQQLLEDLVAQGWQLWVEGDLLRFRAPVAHPPQLVMRELKRHKQDLIALLARQAGSPEGPTVNGGGLASRDQAPGQPAPQGPTVHPASYGQQALWLLHQAAPQSPAYNVASAGMIESPLDVATMLQAWGELVRRHAVLRTTFAMQGGELCCLVHPVPNDTNQDVQPTPQIDAQRIDLTGASEEELRLAAERAYAEPFDLRRGPLARLRLFDAGDGRHLQLVTLHHIVFDAWSLWLLHEEFAALYKSIATASPAPAAATLAEYADFARWQRALPGSAEGEAHWRVWSQRLQGATPGEVAWDRPRPAERRGRGRTLHFRVEGSVAERVRAVAKAHRATPFMTLLAAFQATVSRHSGQLDFVVGATTAGRSRPEFAKVLGYFVNTLPVRAELAGDWSFGQLLQQTRERTLEALGAQDFPFPLIVERLNPPREPGALPLCRIAFGLQKPHKFSQAMEALGDDAPEIDWGGLRMRAYELDQQEGQFDLVLELFETGEGYWGLLKYDPEILDPASAERFADHYKRLLNGALASPETPIAQIDMLGAAEVGLLQQWSRGAELDGDSQTALERFDSFVATRPNEVALVCDSATLTYAQLGERAQRLADRLSAWGVAGRNVACCLERGPDVVVAQIALWRLGAVYVPVDDAGPVARRGAILDDCNAALVLTHTQIARHLGVEDDPRWLPIDSDPWKKAPGKPADATATSTPGDDAYILYTSGSTGRPKGVRVSHAAFAAHLSGAIATYDAGPDDRVLQFSELTFDPSLEQAWVALGSGGTLVVRGPDLWSPSDFWRQIDRHSVTIANLPPAYFHAVSESPPPELPESLRLLIVGGDTLTAGLAQAWRCRPLRVFNAYGPTETVVTSTVFDLQELIEEQCTVPIGRPLPGRSAYVVDSVGALAPIGVVGELWIGGPALASGYLGDSMLSAERFVPNPFLPEGASPGMVYKTGDLARWRPGGQLQFLGRADRQVKLSGRRVELSEIESVLESIEGIARAAVRVDNDPAGDPVLVAFCVAKQGSPRDSSALLATARLRLPRHMAPRQVEWLETLPLGPTGKVALGGLRVQFQPAEDQRRPYAPPRNDAERLLAEAWAEVLGVDRVGVHDDFFELGGASLKSLRIVALAEQKGLRLPDSELSPALLFEYPTVSQLAERLTFGAPQDDPSYSVTAAAIRRTSL